MNDWNVSRIALPPAGSPRFWRALDELAGDPVQRQRLADALPQFALMEPGMDRRGFLRLLGASLAFAGLAACSGPPPENIVAEPDRGGRRVPEEARYATALDVGGDIVGVVATLRDGRPIKLDGNPRHPLTRGGSSPRLQAAILDLWDPQRSDAPRRHGVPGNWSAFEEAMAGLRDRFASDAHGLHVITGRIGSPTLSRQRDAFMRAFPAATWHIHEPVDNAWLPLSLADRDIVVAFDADVLGTLPGHIGIARDFAAARKRGARVYAIESTPSLTGRNADHAWPVDVSAMASISAALLAALTGDKASSPADADRQRIHVMADDLRAHRDRSLVIAGPWASPDVRRHVDLIRATLGQPILPFAGTAVTPSLVDDLHAGLVDTLLVLDGNPAYTLPGFAEAASRAATLIHLGRYRDETAGLAAWHLPALHPLETWSDLRAADGTASIVQPVIAPIVDGRSIHDVLDLMTGAVTTDALTRVKQTWPGLDGATWRQSLQNGVIALETGSTPAQPDPPLSPAPSMPSPGASSDTSIDIVFRPDSNLWDGRQAGNAWLQELPRAITTITWGNALLISPQLAAVRDLRDGDVIRVSLDGRSLEGPVLVVPGQAPRTVTVVLGNGRTEGLGSGYGYNGFAFRGRDDQWQATGASLQKVGRRDLLAVTQVLQDMGTRDAIRAVAFGEATEPAHTPPTLYTDAAPAGPRWAMTIDLAACIGCNACTVACQAENNIPVVGKEEVSRGRRMHWIRVDAYFQGSGVAPEAFHQPVPCMHCEHAPCEVVCPVEATVHDSEGLNLQVYNRCIGTRFCANNCPYKVRRFNFLQYADLVSESLKAMRNPEVTVRNKGVMEKCTYCVQRIERAHASASRDHHDVAEVTTACQDACPTRAISFGDLEKPNPELAGARASDRHYVLLEELNTRPRTTYLAATRQRHPEWPAT